MHCFVRLIDFWFNIFVGLKQGYQFISLMADGGSVQQKCFFFFIPFDDATAIQRGDKKMLDRVAMSHFEGCALQKSHLLSYFRKVRHKLLSILYFQYNVYFFKMSLPQWNMQLTNVNSRRHSLQIETEKWNWKMLQTGLESESSTWAPQFKMSATHAPSPALDPNELKNSERHGLAGNVHVCEYIAQWC